VKNHTLQRWLRVWLWVGLCSSIRIDALRYWPGNSLKHPIDHTHMEVHMRVQAGAKPVNEGDRKTAVAP